MTLIITAGGAEKVLFCIGVFAPPSLFMVLVMWAVIHESDFHCFGTSPDYDSYNVTSKYNRTSNFLRSLSKKYFFQGKLVTKLLTFKGIYITHA